MGNNAKSLFCSTNFTFTFKRQLGTQNPKTMSPKGTSRTNFDSEWGNEKFINRISS
jgi:hypothetical protein